MSIQEEDRFRQKLDEGLRSYSDNERPLPGIERLEKRNAFLEHLVRSEQKCRCICAISKWDGSRLHVDSSSVLFDPWEAAVLCKREGLIDEAFWLVFLSVHFGRNRTKDDRTGWRLMRDVYRGLGGCEPWDWARTSPDPGSFHQWLAEHWNDMKTYGFGSHRKRYLNQSNGLSKTVAAIESYVKWVRSPGTRRMMVQDADKKAGPDARQKFDRLYRSMKNRANRVTSFGRLARFDYLTTVGELGLSQIEPGSPYLRDSTGPLCGARLLFGGSTDAKMKASDLDSWVVSIGDRYLTLGMHVLEDALCNWQKTKSDCSGPALSCCGQTALDCQLIEV